eukprot:gb/GEZN01006070.1/.p1 GENE.gb/GEZN01006070.1/~~gb/GEZN01006070.1/.p1  ORF type:complete len:545 (+),score=69.13 gb/GEZN01006070.1/:33-1667(+)
MEIDRVLGPFAAVLNSIIFTEWLGKANLIILWLAFLAVSFTVYLGFPNLRGIRLAWHHIKGTFDDPTAVGEVSHYQSISTAVAGSVGIGNIAGVAFAVQLGGPGAVFWLFFAGFFCMTLKLVEVTLAVKYRDIKPDGSMSGGPMHYLTKSLAERNWPQTGKFLGYFYATSMLLASVGGVAMFQANQAYTQVVRASGGDGSWWADRGVLFGIMFGVLVGAVIIGGLKSISRVTEYLSPIMSFLFIFGCVAVLVAGRSDLLAAIRLICREAFTPKSAYGGLLVALTIGFKRAMFSNETGTGSSSVAYAAAKTKRPVAQGLVSLLEPLVNTSLLCTLNGLVIVTVAYPAELLSPDVQGIQLTSACFERFFSFAPLALMAISFLFAYSSVIAWAYYGLISFGFLFGNSPLKDFCFKLVFCFCTAVGCCVGMDTVLFLADALFFLMAFPNSVALLLCVSSIRADLNEYMEECDDELAARKEQAAQQLVQLSPSAQLSAAAPATGPAATKRSSRSSKAGPTEELKEPLLLAERSERKDRSNERKRTTTES